VDPFVDPGTCRQIPEFHIKVPRERKSLFGVPKIVFTTRSLLNDTKPMVTKAAAMTAAAVTRTGDPFVNWPYRWPAGSIDCYYVDNARW
jgi:hypothetical protein